MWYLRIIDNVNFGFVKSGVHNILITDIPITNEEYDKFFDLQSKGVQFYIFNEKGNGLFDVLKAI